jgi:hypothetical protein
LVHPHVVNLTEVLMDPSDRSIFMVFEYAEHDLLVCSMICFQKIRCLIMSHCYLANSPFSQCAQEADTRINRQIRSLSTTSRCFLSSLQLRFASVR